MWDIEPINNPVLIEKQLQAGPQLSIFISKDVTPEQIYNLIEQYYIYSIVDDNGEDRLITLASAYKGKIQEDTQKTKKAFGKKVKGQVFDDLIHIDEIPYVPFCKNLDPNVINTIQRIYDVQDIEWKGEPRKAVLCHYYDHNNVPEQEGKIISQSKPVRIVPK